MESFHKSLINNRGRFLLHDQEIYRKGVTVAEVSAKPLIPRVRSGIPGFDELVEGGIPRNHVVLLSGQAGSGKTLFGLQFLAKGASEYGERGLYVAFEQSREDVLEHTRPFGWNVEELEAKGALGILSFFGSHAHAAQMLAEMENKVAELRPQRMVVDSVTTLGLHLDMMMGAEMLQMMQLDPKDAPQIPSGEAVTRRAMIEIIGRLKAMRLTALVISELPETAEFLSRDTVSEYLADGVVMMHYLPIGGSVFSNLQVRKMRGTGHRKELFGTEIRPGVGLVVKREGASSISLR